MFLFFVCVCFFSNSYMCSPRTKWNMSENTLTRNRTTSKPYKIGQIFKEDKPYLFTSLNLVQFKDKKQEENEKAKLLSDYDNYFGLDDNEFYNFYNIAKYFVEEDTITDTKSGGNDINIINDMRPPLPKDLQSNINNSHSKGPSHSIQNQIFGNFVVTTTLLICLSS